ncbi:MAG: hypothetical protein KF849_09840 [Rhizobiaceae bacterium]|nr:hypothetical protein [Rhizobiaceae bacterium]
MTTSARLTKTLAVAAALAMAATATLAANRPDTRSMSCERVQSLIRDRGAVVMTTGRHTYERFVARDSACYRPEIAWQTTVRAKDTGACPVYHCINEELVRPRFEFKF